jgi:hypothetical protein
MSATPRMTIWPRSDRAEPAPRTGVVQLSAAVGTDGGEARSVRRLHWVGWKRSGGSPQASSPSVYIMYIMRSGSDSRHRGLTTPPGGP